MGQVLIIKNGNSDARINKFAKESYNTSENRYYNSGHGTLNEKAIIALQDKMASDGIVILITYTNTDMKEIQDVYIGELVSITQKNSIEYIMRVYLSAKSHLRVIKSILDKIDLDIDTDFGYGKYVIMNDMESLYQELKERIITNKKDTNIREEINKEKEFNKKYELDVLAQKDNQSVRVYAENHEEKFGTEFQMDRERVVNSKAFRRLVDKAQIFGAEKGDYYRTRMTHTLEVNQIAKAIAHALHLNLDLTEAIALGHDLGHTPFGHQGERTLDEILSGKIAVGIVGTPEMFQKRCYGGFKHNYQSAKILTEIEEKYKEFPGLNVSVQVVEGVLKHTKLKLSEICLEDFLSSEYIEKLTISQDEKQICSTLEGQVVAIADEIAQRGHDVDDALTSGVMTIEEFKDQLRINKCNELFKEIDKETNSIVSSKRHIADKKELMISRIVSIIVNYFVSKTIEYSTEIVKEYREMGELSLDNTKELVVIEPEAKRVNDYLERVVQKKVICNYEVARADHNASKIVQKLFSEYYKNPRLLHMGTVHKIFIETLNHPNSDVANSAIYLNDASIKLANEEIAEITRKELDEK